MSYFAKSFGHIKEYPANFEPHIKNTKDFAINWKKMIDARISWSESRMIWRKYMILRKKLKKLS